MCKLCETSLSGVAEWIICVSPINALFKNINKNIYLRKLRESKVQKHFYNKDLPRTVDDVNRQDR